ncbi:MAG: hypothetical protein LBG93_09430 [Treponema sp.]|jgi:hypothetical protein|nr:hypothetical protein [Treponema sp.]
MKIITASLVFFALLFCAIPVDAQNAGRPWWFRLEEGKFLFRNGEYGGALIAFDDARRSRLEQFTRVEQDLIRLLSTPEARQLGDSLYFVERLIEMRNETQAAAALAYLFHRVPRSVVGGSATRALEELDRLKPFPEAEFWMGEAFMAEGEWHLALVQFERAWHYRELLETPGFELKILFRITDIHRMRQEYAAMEARALEVITQAGVNLPPQDNLWASMLLRAAMVNLLENEGVNRFLSLYRDGNIAAEPAHRLLGSFFHVTRRDFPALEHLMFAFLIQNTVIIDYVIRRQFDFAFTTLEDLMSVALTRPALVAFMEEVEYFRIAFYFATALHATGRTAPALEVWNFLANSDHSGIWGVRARLTALPVLEPAIELP